MKNDLHPFSGGTAFWFPLFQPTKVFIRGRGAGSGQLDQFFPPHQPQLRLLCFRHTHGCLRKRGRGAEQEPLRFHLQGFPDDLADLLGGDLRPGVLGKQPK